MRNTWGIDPSICYHDEVKCLKNATEVADLIYPQLNHTRLITRVGGHPNRGIWVIVVPSSNASFE